MIIEYDSLQQTVRVSIPIEDKVHDDIEDRIVNSFWDIFTEAMLDLGYSDSYKERDLCKAIADSFNYHAKYRDFEDREESELIEETIGNNEIDRFFYWHSKNVYNQFICSCDIEENELLSDIRKHEIYPNKRETDCEIIFELCDEDDCPLTTIIEVSKSEDKQTISDVHDIANAIVAELIVRALPQRYKSSKQLSFF